MDYAWDNAKARANRRKHGVDFRDAIAALEDPNRLEVIDMRDDYGEIRLQVIGMARDRILFVATAMLDEEACRIISARKATQNEQDRHDAGDEENW